MAHVFLLCLLVPIATLAVAITLGLALICCGLVSVLVRAVLD